MGVVRSDKGPRTVRSRVKIRRFLPASKSPDAGDSGLLFADIPGINVGEKHFKAASRPRRLSPIEVASGILGADVSTRRNKCKAYWFLIGGIVGPI